MTDFSQTKIRCSALYNIMGSDRKKTNMQLYEEACIELVKKNEGYAKLKKKDGPRADQLLEAIEKLSILIPILESQRNVDEPLSVGCKSHLSTVYAAQKYGKWSANKDKGNKYTDKGKEAEEESITLISRLDKILYEKNEERIENDFLCGHPDIFEGESTKNATKIIDVKTSWDIETFFSNLGKPLNPQYYWQIQGYLALTGAQVGEVHFCLVNTPESILNDEKYRLFRRMNVPTEDNIEYLKAAAELINNLTFDDMPIEDRRIKFIVERNDADIEMAYNRVKKCREWLAELEKLHLNVESMATLLSQ